MPRAPRITWPTVRLAANRRARVKNRTSMLIVSTITKKGLNIKGAPEGSKEAADK